MRDSFPAVSGGVLNSGGGNIDDTQRCTIDRSEIPNSISKKRRFEELN